MQRKTCIALLLSAGAIAIAIAAPSLATAASYKDIAGAWCGNTTNYTFDRKSLRVFWHADRTGRTFRITDYDYGDDEITVHWRKDGETVFTTFNQFSGGTMVQKRSDNGPRREFHRC